MNFRVLMKSREKKLYISQGMSCEVAVARVRVRTKSFLKSVRDVRACGSFLGVRCATIFFHTFGTKLP